MNSTSTVSCSCRAVPWKKPWERPRVSTAIAPGRRHSALTPPIRRVQISAFTLPMPRGRKSAFTLPKLRGRTSAFTLVELLVVIAIILVLTLLLAPAFTSLKSAGDVTSAAETIKDALEQARTYAMANNTYTWVGFFEEDAGSTSAANPRPPGVGAIVVSIVAATDGKRYRDTLVDNLQPHAFYPPPTPSPSPTPGDYNSVILAQVQKLVKAQNVHLAVVSSTLARPTVGSDYQVGAINFELHPPSNPLAPPVPNPTTFNYPLSAASNAIQYTFKKIIEFGPRGDAIKIVDFPTPLLEIGMQPTHGTTIDASSPNVVAIQIDGATGKVRVYRR